MTDEKTNFHSFPSIPVYAANKRNWTGTNSQWYIQEKLDGSQLSWSTRSGKIKFYNGTKQIISGKQFDKAIAVLTERQADFNPNYTYHAECIQQLKHNVVVYKRLPTNYVVVYDIQTENKHYLWPTSMAAECQRAGLEHARLLCDGAKTNPQDTSPDTNISHFMTAIEEGKIVSMLGGTPEGIVLKHPCFEKDHRFTAMKFKIVSEKFRERHAKKQPKVGTYSPVQFLEWLGSQFATVARLNKAIQHLKERGTDQPSQQMIVDELDRDLLKEFNPVLRSYIATEFTPHIPKYRDDYKSIDPLTPIFRKLAANNIVDPVEIYAHFILLLLPFTRPQTTVK